LLLDNVLQWITTYGYAGIFCLLVLGIVGLPVPDETLMTFTGYLIFKGKLSFAPAFAAAFLGSVCGITISYWLGRKLGLPLVHRYGKYVHFGQSELDRVHNWFHRIGRWTLTFGYFVPGVRHFTAYVAGTTDMAFPEFALFAYPGAFIWCLTFISLGYYFGDRWDWVLARMHEDILYVSIAAGVCVLVYVLYRKFVKRSNSKPE
jgi:membrane protein DedA with SNARE-associated domain